MIAALCSNLFMNFLKISNLNLIKGRDYFDSRDAFYDKVDYFLDPLFWEDYNIIEPSVSLDEAIDKLLKRKGFTR